MVNPFKASVSILLMTAETGISVSEDPSFRFFLKPRAEGELTAEITDSKGTTWSESIAVGTGGSAPRGGGEKKPGV